jgi:predicted nucleotidyltransferase component of viral defense system
MNLLNDEGLFHELIMEASADMNIPESAVERDYYIVMVLRTLAASEFKDNVVFKGGTSLSKCYPGSIMRFSEDIDLTYIPDENESEKQISKKLKRIEKILLEGFNVEKIDSERNNRNKSAWLWKNDERKFEERIKLEIGSSVRTHPFSEKEVRSYIYEFLLNLGDNEIIIEYGIQTVVINALDIERTFVDKLMSVKRHAICGTLTGKVRHIYDIVMLFELPEIKRFIVEKDKLKDIVRLTKETDTFYLGKRNISDDYNPDEAFGFEKWIGYFDKDVKRAYERLHEHLLFTNEKQDFEKAINIFNAINEFLKEVEE